MAVYIRCVWKRFQRRSIYARRVQSISAEVWLCGIIRIPLFSALRGKPPPFQPFQTSKRASAYCYYYYTYIYIYNARAHVWHRGHHSVAAAARRNYWVPCSGLCRHNYIVFLLLHNNIINNNITSMMARLQQSMAWIYEKGFENCPEKSPRKRVILYSSIAIITI